MSPAFPPLDGSIPVLPGFVDFCAKHNPTAPYAVLVPEEGHELQEVSFDDFARATHRVAHYVNPIEHYVEREVVAILTHIDTLIYTTLIAGVVRAGQAAFPISPRNSAEAVVHLLKKTSCHKVIVHGLQPSLLETVKAELDKEQYELQIQDVPDIDFLYPRLKNPQAANDVEEYPFVEITQEDIGVYLHSSGSTGLPKPIPWGQKQLLQFCRTSSIREAGNRGIKWAAMGLPTFHAIGFFTQILGPIASGCCTALYRPRFPNPPTVPTPQNVIEGSKIAGCTAMPSVPAFIEAWAHSEDHVRYLASMTVVLFGGGPLSETVGRRLVNEGVPLAVWYGGTEFGPPVKILDIVENSEDPQQKTMDDWQYVEIEDMVKHRWVPEGDGQYELQILTCDTWVPSVENMTDPKGYATNDLWMPHPTKPHLWRITGRKDDVIVLGSGEKVVPTPQELRVTASPLVNGAVVFGRGRNECGILIEPKPEHVVDHADQKAVAAFRDKIWPVVEEANAAAPGFAKIFKETILVTDPAKPLPRAAKGTVIRKQAETLYKDEIEELYNFVEESSGARDVSPPNSWTAADIEAWLVEHSSSIHNDKPMSPTVDVFEQGFDSLHATFLRNRIISVLRANGDPRVKSAAQNISPNFVFENNTLHAIASTLASLVEHGAEGGKQKTVEESISEMIAKYSANLPQRPAMQSKSSGDPVVLLTGSTGGLGSYVLADLLREEKVKKVYTLNRPSADPLKRQNDAFTERGLDVALLKNPKLVPLAGETARENLGLEAAVFGEIKESVTHVIHNAWRVDFNHPLASFENNIAGSRQLVDLCGASTQAAKLFFTSSIATAHKWDISQGPIPDEVLPDPKLASSSGYSASKFVVEVILELAYKKNIECTTLRVGQICGDKASGAWATSDWLPNLVKSSLSIGAFPELVGTISWIPTDALARAVLDLVLSERTLPPLINALHPREVPWSTFSKAAKKSLGKPDIPDVPLSEWVAKIEAIAAKASPEDIERTPATKLLDFYHGLAATQEHAVKAGVKDVEAGGLPVYQTRKLQEFCPSVKSLEQVDETYVEAFVRYWRSKGFLPS